MDTGINTAIMQRAYVSAHRIVRQYQGTYGAVEGARKAADEFRRNSGLRSMSAVVAEAAQDRLDRLSPTVQRSLVATLQRVMEERERAGEDSFPRPMVVAAIHDEVPELSADEAETVTDVLEAHLPEVVGRLVSDAAGEDMRQELEAIRNELRVRLSAGSFARVWSVVFNLFVLLVSIGQFWMAAEQVELGQEQAEIGRRQVALAEAQMAEAREAEEERVRVDSTAQVRDAKQVEEVVARLDEMNRILREMDGEDRN